MIDKNNDKAKNMLEQTAKMAGLDAYEAGQDEVNSVVDRAKQEWENVSALLEAIKKDFESRESE